MSKILELRTKRNTLWEQTKDFLEKNRGENGLVKAEAVEQYNKMAQEVKDLGAEIERLEQQAQIEAQLSAPTSNPVHADPKNGAKKDVKPTATAEYAENFWNMIRNRGHYGEVRNALSVGEDTEGGFTVPDEFEKKLVEALEENNIFRGMATVIRTSSGTRKCAMTRSIPSTRSIPPSGSPCVPARMPKYPSLSSRHPAARSEAGSAVR